MTHAQAHGVLSPRIVPIRLEHIYRFPVKGLAAEPLAAVPLTAGKGLPHDRRFAIARGDSNLDFDTPHWRPKQWFVMLMRDTALARVRCHLDVDAQRVELSHPGQSSCVARFDTLEGRQQIDAYINAALGERREGPARWVEASGISFTDVPQNCLSLINLESVRHAEARLGASLDPLRFRANLYICGAAPWSEFDWVGRDIQVGDVTLAIPSRIPRCAATAVNPQTGERDVNVVKGLRSAYGHYDMGVYAEVKRDGNIRVGDTIVDPQHARPRSRAEHWLRFVAFLARSAPTLWRRR